MYQLRWLLKNMKGKRLEYYTGIVISILTSAFVIINPKISQILVDEVIVGVTLPDGTVDHHLDRLVPLLLLMVLVQVTVSSLRYLMIMLFERSSQHVLMKLRTRLYDNLQKQDMHFYDTYRTGDLMTRLTGDLDMIRHFVSWITFNIVDSIVLFTVTMTYFFTISWKLTLVLLITAPIMFLITYFFSKRIRPVFVSLRERLSLMNTAAQENISGNRVVKAFNRESFEMGKFREKNKDFHDNNLKASYTWLKFFPVIETLAQSLTIITLLFGGIQIMEGGMTFGDLTAFTALTWALSNPMRLLGQILNDFNRFLASANKIIELYYESPRILNRHDAVADRKFRGDIAFENVSFRYGADPVFENLSLHIKAGSTVGIMGATGTGKTTLVNLLARFYDVTSGSIKVDGVDVRQVDLAALRSQIGMATQDVFLFSETVDGNIAYGDPDLPEEDVRRYAAAADADDFISHMPEGYDTIVGERGVGLSGGQKQRLALARALAVRPRILVLDDTTSAVDFETERTIQENIAKLDFPCTKLIIAHRITSVRNADNIIVLGEHNILEQGTHEELLKKGGYYSEIYALQQESAGATTAGDRIGA